MRRRIDDERFADAVRAASGIASVLRALGLKANGANYQMVRRRVRAAGLSTVHWLGMAHRRGSTKPVTPGRPLEELLVERSTHANLGSLKRRLLRAGLLARECARCGIRDWMGDALTLVLDHVNGVPDDNRLENLRLLCPNCHSQTPTFAGRNKGKLARLLAPT